MRKKITMGLVLLILAGLGIISMDQYFKYCQNNPTDSNCPVVEPTPEPTIAPTPTPPIVEPTPIPPTPVPTPTTEPTPVPTPTPIVSKCLAGTCPEGDRYINRRLDGNKYVDSTMRCRNREYCEKATGIPETYDCALGIEGTDQRIICELKHSPGCLRWYYKNPQGVFVRCLPYQHPVASCDHYDRYIEWQGPYTGKCEVDDTGFPIAGNTTIPHGKTDFMSCDYAGKICSSVLSLDR